MLSPVSGLFFNLGFFFLFHCLVCFSHSPSFSPFPCPLQWSWKSSIPHWCIRNIVIFTVLMLLFLCIHVHTYCTHWFIGRPLCLFKCSAPYHKVHIVHKGASTWISLQNGHRIQHPFECNSAYAGQQRDSLLSTCFEINILRVLWEIFVCHMLGQNFGLSGPQVLNKSSCQTVTIAERRILGWSGLTKTCMAVTH